MLAKYFAFVVVILYFSTIVIQVMGQSGSCPDGTFEAANHACFKLINDRKTFSDAEDSCASMGGHLAVINNSFVNNDIARRFFIVELVTKILLQFRTS